MIAADPNSTCGQAQAYYYDYLSEDARKGVPAEIAVHVGKCSFCQGEVDRLKIVLADAEGGGTDNAEQTTSAATTNLRLHFAHTGASVTCSMVKPFLPSLAIPAFEVGVPTPITVHIDKCQQCADELEVIRKLNLTDRQLCRLSQLFAEEPSESGVQSREHFHTEPATEADTEENLACDAVLPSDIFDYCFRYGTDPANDEHAKLSPSLMTHLAKCPTCQGKMQQLHRTVCSIAERPDSDVLTRFTFEKQISERAESESLRLYEDWPINVQVLDKSGRESEGPLAAVGPQKEFRQRLLALVRPFVKPVAAAAAVVLVALLLFNVPVARAVDLGQIYEALGHVKNACLTTFIPEESEPTKRRWISKALNITMVKAEAEWILWDIKGKSKKSKDLSTGSITVTELGQDILARVEKTMEVPRGLLPFNDMSEVPPDAEWDQAANETVETTIAGTEVYELVWKNRRLGGSEIIHRKWRGYIDVRARLPRRIEWWEKHAGDGEYKLVTIIDVTYPTVIEIQSVIKEAGL